MPPAANRHAHSIRMAVPVIAPADRFQQPVRPVQKAQKTATKLKGIEERLLIVVPSTA